MTDQPGWLSAVCFDWKPWNSAVTWATGYLATSPDGPKAAFSGYSANSPLTWDKARTYLHKSLTLTTKKDRDIYLAWTFEALGRTLHLLQDMAVPAHVRNDFTSHLDFNGVTSLNPFVWYIQRFEYYVQLNPFLITVELPVWPSSFSRLTQFWDADLYNGSNPSATMPVGLSEFTNANYFSDNTIPGNRPLPQHSFPYPYVRSNNTSGGSYQICADYAHDSTKIRKYISRKEKGPCPPLSPTRSTDHFGSGFLDPSG
jgi:hypothetical protein